MQYARPQSRFLPLWIITASVIAGALIFLVPVAEGTPNETAAHWRAAVSTLILCLFLGSATSFLNGLKGFKRDLRIAYRLLAYGIIAFGIALVQLVIWGVLDMWDSAWATSGSGLLPYLVTAVFTYAGARTFAHLVGVRSIWGSFPLAMVVTLAVGVAGLLLARAYVQYELPGVDIYIAVGAWFCGLLALATVLVYKIYRSIGSHYTAAMRWLTIGLAGLLAAAVHETVNTFWFTNGDPYTDYGYYLIPWIPAGLLLIRASYEFRRLPAAETAAADAAAAPQPVAGRAVPAEPKPKDYIDSIVAVAGLASQPQEIDRTLDALRVVTSRLAPGAELDNQQKEILIKTYYRIETYLGEQDAMRTFTKDEVRSHVTTPFRALLDKDKPKASTSPPPAAPPR